MSSNTPVNKSGQKWISSTLAIACIILFYVILRFFNQVGEWFELEAKISNFSAITQGLSVLIGIGTFFSILKHPFTSSYLRECYEEMVKVVFPDKNETMSMSIKVMILVTIIGFILGVFDLGASYFVSILTTL